MPSNANLLTEQDVSRHLHISVASLRRWRLENRGPRFIKVGSLVRYRPEDLDTWLLDQPTGGAAVGKRAYRSAQDPRSDGERIAS
jgi:predicted DNA-binding transcriptional regulator AlpA